MFVNSLKIIKSQTQKHRAQRTTIQCKRRADQAAERERGNGEDDNSAAYFAVLIPRWIKGGAILRSPQVIIPQRCTLAASCHPSAGSLRQRIILRSFRAPVDSQPANMGMNTWEQGIAASSHLINARLGQAGNGSALTRVLRQRLTTPAGTGQEISKRWKSKVRPVHTYVCTNHTHVFAYSQ